MKEHILDKYWKTHDYDIVKGEYCDFGKEVNYQNTIKMNETTHVKPFNFITMCAAFH